MNDIKLNKTDFEKYYDKALAWVSKHHSKIENYNQMEGYIVGVMQAMKKEAMKKEAR
jgi:hypothetical protein